MRKTPQASTTPVNTPAAVPSPCVSLCQMQATTGWCRGCLRTLDEIAGWGQLDDAGKRAVLQQLPARRVHWRALPPAVRDPATPAPPVGP